MTKSLAAAWGRHGIRVNTLIPEMTEGAGGIEALHQSEVAYEEAITRIPLGRMVTKQVARPHGELPAW